MKRVGRVCYGLTERVGFGEDIISVAPGAGRRSFGLMEVGINAGAVEAGFAWGRVLGQKRGKLLRAEKEKRVSRFDVEGTVWSGHSLGLGSQFGSGVTVWGRMTIFRVRSHSLVRVSVWRPALEVAVWRTRLTSFESQWMKG